MKKRDIIKNKILDLLKRNLEPVKRLDLLCSIYGFRQAGGSILVWSIKERKLLQNEQFDKAAELLEAILTVCNETMILKNQNELEAQKRFNLIHPPIKPSLFESYIAVSLQVDEDLMVGKKSRWHQLNEDVKPFIEKWHSRDWMRHTIERKYADLPEMDKERKDAHMGVSRAIASLQAAQKIKVVGSRKEILISLLELS